MSGLFGGGSHSQSTTPQRYNGMQISASSYGGAIPLLYGRARLPFTLMWYGAFTSSSVKSSQGGKGGGGGQQASSYTYSTAFAACLCEGPIPAGGVTQVWHDKDLTTLAAQGLTLFRGTGGQATWSFLSSNFPAQAIPYDHLCYVASSNYSLGSSAAMPNLTFETDGFLGYNIAGGIYDADPSQFIPDYITDVNHGVGQPSSFIASLSGNDNYQGYVQSLGLLLSPYESTQRAAADFLKEILQITNSDGVWTAGQLKILPYCDAAVAGNGFTFTPNLTPVFSFTDDDFMPAQGDPPVKLSRKRIADTYNHVKVEYLDRSNGYNVAIAEATDLGDIVINGERTMSTLSFHSICNVNVARTVAQLILQTSLYERNTYTFRVRADYSLLEPMDYVAITDNTVGGLGLVNQVVRITKITDSAADEIEIEAMEVPGTVRNAPQYNWQSVQGYNANFAVAPGSVQAPVFIDAGAALVESSGRQQLWIAVCEPTSSGSWGGCNVFMSFDGTTYDQIGTVTSAARYGTLTANISSVADPDSSSTLSVALANTTLVLGTGTLADADGNRMLIAVGSGATLEMMSYQTATLTSAGHYNITYLRRGLYGTSVQAHSSGAQFMRLDGNIFQLTIDPGWVGQTLHFKFCSFNLYGRATEAIASVTDYTYVPAALSVVGDVLLIPRGACAVTGNSVYKQTTGSAAWDSDAYSPQGFANGCFVSWRAGQSNLFVMVGLSSNPTATTNYPSLDYALYTDNAGVIELFESGTKMVANAGSYATGDTFEIRYDGVTIRYFHNGVLIRAIRAAGKTLYPKVCTFSPGAVVGNIQYGPATSQTQIGGNWLTTYPWVIGTGNSQGNYSDNFDGTNHDSAIVMAGVAGAPVGPYGQSEPLWQTVGAGANGNGGWNNTGDLYGIDSNKTYRSVVWLRWNGVGAGQFFHGCDGTYTNDLAGTQNTNPYFHSGSLASLTANKWYLEVGILHGSGYGTSSSGISGLYDPATGVKISSGTDYKCIAGAPYQTQRVYQYYANNAGSVVYFARPRFEEVNGAEPSITTLISPAGALAYADNLDQVPNGSTYAKTLSTYIQSGVPYMYRGAWSGATAYKVGDEATSGGNYYICTAANTNQAPPNATYWTLLGPVTLDSLSDGGTYARPLSGYLVNGVPYTLRGAYSGGTTYKIGDEVLSSGNHYVCIAPTTGNAPPNTTYWQILATATQFIATGNCLVSDTNAMKQGGSGAWDSCVYSNVGFPTCHIVAKANSTSDNVMMGFATSPTASSSFTNMNYGWYNAGGTWQIYESGALIGSFGTITVKDVVAVTYDGSNIRYYLNTVLQRTVAVAGLTLYGFCPFNSVGAGLNSLSFGPTTNLAVTDSSQINNNAVQNQHVADGAIDPSTAQVTAKGSIPPSLVSISFSYTSTTTSVTISWGAMTIYRDDGTTTAVSSGSLAITALTASHTYKVYPYLDDTTNSTVVTFVSGTGGTQAGSPGACYSGSGDAVAASVMYFRGHVPLNAFQVTTPASGSGGGGGGGVGCLHPRTRIVLADGRETTAGELQPGDELPAPEGAGRIAFIARRRCSRWLRVGFGRTETIVTFDHRFLLATGGEARGEDLRIGDILAADGDHLEVTLLELVREDESLVSIELDQPHLYYLGRGGPLCHNPKP